MEAERMTAQWREMRTRLRSQLDAAAKSEDMAERRRLATEIEEMAAELAVAFGALRQEHPERFSFSAHIPTTTQSP